MPAGDGQQLPPGTAADLIADARTLGLAATPRMITDWISRGLLDGPQHHGAGQGHGSQKGVFSANQRQLFRELLVQRESVHRLGSLTPIPLVLWAYWGDDYVPTRQARRALKGSLRTREVPRERARNASREYVRSIAHPEAASTPINALQRLLEQAMVSGGIANPKAFNTAYMKVFDPRRTGRPILPEGVDVGMSTTPEILVRSAIHEQHAAAAVRKPGAVTEQHLEKTRSALQRSLIEYGLINSVYAGLSGLDLGAVVAHPDLQLLTRRIVRNILLVLGAVLQAERTLP